jgi:hypothetical protein
MPSARIVSRSALTRGIGILGLERVLGVAEAVVPAGEPRVLVDHRGHQLGHLVIGALPQRAEGARRADDRQVVDVVALGDLGQAIGHARAAGDARRPAPGLLEHAFEHLLRAAHFPQHVDVDRAAAAGDVVGAAHLLDRAVDRVADQLLVPLERVSWS